MGILDRTLAEKDALGKVIGTPKVVKHGEGGGLLI
jgi:hypothetical protein